MQRKYTMAVFIVIAATDEDWTIKSSGKVSHFSGTHAARIWVRMLERLASSAAPADVPWVEWGGEDVTVVERMMHSVPAVAAMMPEAR